MINIFLILAKNNTKRNGKRSEGMFKSEKKNSKKGILLTMGALMTVGAMSIWKKSKKAMKTTCEKCKSMFKSGTE